MECKVFSSSAIGAAGVDARCGGQVADHGTRTYALAFPYSELPADASSSTCEGKSPCLELRIQRANEARLDSRHDYRPFRSRVMSAAFGASTPSAASAFGRVAMTTSPLAGNRAGTEPGLIATT
jgi:hypothetical protein